MGAMSEIEILTADRDEWKRRAEKLTREVEDWKGANRILSECILELAASPSAGTPERSRFTPLDADQFAEATAGLPETTLTEDERASVDRTNARIANGYTFPTSPRTSEPSPDDVAEAVLARAMPPKGEKRDIRRAAINEPCKKCPDCGESCACLRPRTNEACSECAGAGLAPHTRSGDLTATCPIYLANRDGTRTAWEDRRRGRGERPGERPDYARNDAEAMAHGYAVAREIALAALVKHPALQSIVASRLGAAGPRPETAKPAPIPMVLHCPECRTRHVDEGDFATKPHHTHSCQGCGLTWRPAVIHTVGVQFLPGFKNEPASPTGSEGT